MAYVTNNTTKAIRNALKAEFPNAKFSVSKEDISSIRVAVMQSDVFAQDQYSPVNHYYIENHYRGIECAFLLKVDEIIRTAGEWWDKSDIQSDYFNTAFYYNITIGKWDKKHKRTPLK